MMHLLAFRRAAAYDDETGPVRGRTTYANSLLLADPPLAQNTTAIAGNIVGIHAIVADKPAG